jgi:hypothetical protein
MSYQKKSYLQFFSSYWLECAITRHIILNKTQLKKCHGFDTMLRMQSRKKKKKKDKNNLNIYYCSFDDVLIQENALCRLKWTITPLQMWLINFINHCLIPRTKFGPIWERKELRQEITIITNAHNIMKNHVHGNWITLQLELQNN